VLGVAVTVLLLWWTLRDVSFAVVLGHIRAANPLLLLATVVTATLTFPLRAVRWQLILRDASGGRFPLVPLWHAVAVGFMANNLLPARAGEVARAYIAGRQLPVRFTTALASVAVERMLDGLVMVGLMAIAIAAPAFPSQATVFGAPLSRVATGGALLFGAALLVALVVVHRPVPSLTLLDRVARRVLSQRLALRVGRVGEGLVAGLAVLKNPGRFGAVVAWSLVLWLVNAVAFALCFKAFALPVPMSGALLLQGIIGFGVAVPSSPGFFGVFEAATRVTLGIYGIDATRAVSYAVAYHLTTFLPITLLGLWSLSVTHVRIGDLRGTGTEE
jgi:uncharacterized protein (TIRG00374 family)